MQVNIYTENIYNYGEGLNILMLLKKKNPLREKKIRDYVQYPNVIRAIKARTLDFYFPIWYPFHTVPPQT